MRYPSDPRKRVKHYHDPGHCRELTFSCYQRLPLLTNDRTRAMLSQSIERACISQGWALTAFVYMPEHVHLLVYPTNREARIDAFLRAVKRPFSFRMKQWFREAQSPWLKKLTVRRPGMTSFRFWQAGGGYDRNLTNEKTVLASIDYLHLNPVRRGLCKEPTDWRWSSAAWYAAEGRREDPDLPKLTPMPAEFFVGGSGYSPD